MNPKPSEPFNRPCLCIAGTHSGCGKTTVSLGIMSALVNRGYRVQPFKVGPDFIDPGHHRRITGRDSQNLDGWMMDKETNRSVFDRYRRDADVAVVEGVMGLFDGFSGRDETGSTAQMAKGLDLPTIIVIDARAMARSAAAIALGFSAFDSALPLKGVIFNRLGSKGHGDLIREAMVALPHIPVVGYLPRQADLEIPSRHLGLVTDEDFRADDIRIKRLGQWIEDHLDLDPLIEMRAGREAAPVRSTPVPRTNVRIAVAQDEAFCFYYPENLRLLRMAGAELVPFSPLRSRHLPHGISGLLLGGGYPELHSRTLSRNTGLLNEIKAFGLSGRPVYAECGGFMYLMKEIRDFEGERHPMVGIFDMAAQMEKRLRSLGYREVRTLADSALGPAGTTIRGHEFHYSRIREGAGRADTVYTLTDRKGKTQKKEGFSIHRVLGSYVHLHWGSNPGSAEYFVNYCRRFDSEKIVTGQWQ